MAITAISAALGLGRLIALPFAGPLSDKLGRRISTAIGSGSYAIYLIGLALAFNAGTHGGYQIAYVCAIVGGIANSFLDTGIYPAVSEIIYKAPGVATMGIKFFIAIAQMMLPFVLGVTVATTAAGLTSYNMLFYVCGIAYIVLLVLVMIFPLPDADQKAAGKKEGLIDSLKHTHFSVESVAMILIGFTCTGTFQLWLNCAQNFAKENVGWANPSIMQTYYSAGTMLALVVTALLTKKIKDVRFILVYPVICLATLVVVLIGKSEPLMIAGAFLIGWAGAGGLLQIATSVCNMLFPKIKGTVTALVMIASSLCNYTILTAASKMQPAQVMVMNIVLTTVGVLLGLFVNLRYTKMVEQAKEDNYKRRKQNMSNYVEVRGVKIGEGVPKICVPIVGKTKEEILAAAKSFADVKMDVVEWRVDWFEGVFDFAQVEDVLKDLRPALGNTPILFTFRTSKEGGEKAIEPAAYVELNKKAAATGLVDLVDVEAFTGDEYVKEIIAAAHESGVAVVASNHDFDKTPDKDDIVSRLRKMQDLDADIPKIAVMPQNKKDVLTLLAATEEMVSEYADRPIITMSMAGTGLISRLCGEVFGSALTFGAVGKASAPGQMNAADLSEILTLIHKSM